MTQTIHIDCPAEVLLGLHCGPEELARLVTLRAAVALFKEGRISSGLAAEWCGLPRPVFLLEAMRAGAELLEDSDDDQRRETSLV